MCKACATATPLELGLGSPSRHETAAICKRVARKPLGWFLKGPDLSFTRPTLPAGWSQPTWMARHVAHGRTHHDVHPRILTSPAFADEPAVQLSAKFNITRMTPRQKDAELARIARRRAGHTEEEAA